MKKETLIDIAYITRMFFGIGLIFTYLFSTDYRTVIILTNLVLYIISAIFYKIVKK